MNLCHRRIAEPPPSLMRTSSPSPSKKEGAVFYVCASERETKREEGFRQSPCCRRCGTAKLLAVVVKGSTKRKRKPILLPSPLMEGPPSMVSATAVHVSSVAGELFRHHQSPSPPVFFETTGTTVQFPFLRFSHRRNPLTSSELIKQPSLSPESTVAAAIAF